MFFTICSLVGDMDAQGNDSNTNTVTPLQSSEGVKDSNQPPNTNSATPEQTNIVTDDACNEVEDNEGVSGVGKKRKTRCGIEPF